MKKKKKKNKNKNKKKESFFLAGLAATQNDPNVWKQRQLHVGKSTTHLKQEFDIVGTLAEQYPNNYLIWDHRRWIIEKMGSEPTIIDNELQFTKKIISKGARNLQAWSHREWIIQKFDNSLWEKEIEYCKKILDFDTFNVSAWDQICRSVWFYPSKKKKELRDREAEYAKRAIYDQPGNEGPWLYLKFLYVGDKKSLFRDPYLECIYVDVLAEEADHIISFTHFNPHPRCRSTYALVDSRRCLNALNIIVDLMDLGYKADANRRLVEAVDILLYHLDFSFSFVPPILIRNGSKFYRKVCALVLSLDACRVRYHYMYRGYDICQYYALYDYEEEMNEHLQCSHDEIAMDRSDDVSTNLLEDMFNTSHGEIAMDISDMFLQRLEDMFKDWVTSNNFDRLRPEWKEHLFEVFLNKRRRYDRLDRDVLKDLKWDARRLVVKGESSESSNDVALNELKYTSDVIKDDAYNYCAWSHRHWVFQTFGETWDDQAELDFCATIIKNNPYNSFAWDQRYFVITRLVPKSYTCRPKKDFDDVGLYQEFVKNLDRRMAEEVDFVLTAIKANPENQIPWGHISGIYHAYSDSLQTSMFNGSLINAMLHVLEEKAEVGSRWKLDPYGTYRVENARGIMNLLNAFCDFIINRGLSITDWDRLIPDSVGAGSRFEEALSKMCPDTSIYFNDFSEEWKIYPVDRIRAIVESLETALTDCRLCWQNRTDEIICDDGYWLLSRRR